MRRQFTFSNVDTSRMQVKISRDFTKVVLANKDENYLLFWDQTVETFTQKVIRSLKEKNVTGIFNQGPEFFFTCNKDYDTSIQVQNSGLEEFKIKIPRKIEPDAMIVYDIA